MRNRPGVTMLVIVVLLALACRAVLAQIGPRYSVQLKAGMYTPAQQGRVELAGSGLALIRYQGLAILAVGADADAYSAEAVRHWPVADLLVLTPANHGRYGGLAPLASLHGLGVVLPELGGHLAVPPPDGQGPRWYPLHTWDALHLRKGKTSLRVTAMPGQPGTAHVAGFMLELGHGRASYRVYLGCTPLADEELRALPDRLPGADLALLPAQQGLQLLPLRSSQAPAALPPGGYAFTAVRR